MIADSGTKSATGVWFYAIFRLNFGQTFWQ
jgi:hypothetical protein